VFKLIGHDFECFRNANHALSDPEAFNYCDILISDFYLPDINGIELIKRVHQIRHDIPAILLTGSRDAGIRNASEKIENCSILYKPINIEDTGSGRSHDETGLAKSSPSGFLKTPYDDGMAIAKVSMSCTRAA
jgi:DNA-binding NtrC family response regulator